MNEPKECNEIVDLKIKIARLEEKLIGSDKALELAKETMKSSVDLMDKRLAGMNEFRDTLKDQASNFVTRTEFNQITSFQNRIIGAVTVLAFFFPILINFFSKKGP